MKNQYYIIFIIIFLQSCGTSTCKTPEGIEIPEKYQSSSDLEDENYYNNFNFTLDSLSGIYRVNKIRFVSQIWKDEKDGCPDYYITDFGNSQKNGESLIYEKIINNLNSYHTNSEIEQINIDFIGNININDYLSDDELMKNKCFIYNDGPEDLIGLDFKNNLLITGRKPPEEGTEKFKYLESLIENLGESKKFSHNKVDKILRNIDVEIFDVEIFPFITGNGEDLYFNNQTGGVNKSSSNSSWNSGDESESYSGSSEISSDSYNWIYNALNTKNSEFKHHFSTFHQELSTRRATVQESIRTGAKYVNMREIIYDGSYSIRSTKENNEIRLFDRKKGVYYYLEKIDPNISNMDIIHMEHNPEKYTDSYNIGNKPVSQDHLISYKHFDYDLKILDVSSSYKDTHTLPVTYSGKLNKKIYGVNLDTLVVTNVNLLHNYYSDKFFETRRTLPDSWSDLTIEDGRLISYDYDSSKDKIMVRWKYSNKGYSNDELYNLYPDFEISKKEIFERKLSSYLFYNTNLNDFIKKLSRDEYIDLILIDIDSPQEGIQYKPINKYEFNESQRVIERSLENYFFDRSGKKEWTSNEYSQIKKNTQDSINSLKKRKFIPFKRFSFQINVPYEGKTDLWLETIETLTTLRNQVPPKYEFEDPKQRNLNQFKYHIIPIKDKIFKFQSSDRNYGGTMSNQSDKNYVTRYQKYLNDEDFRRIKGKSKEEVNRKSTWENYVEKGILRTLNLHERRISGQSLRNAKIPDGIERRNLSGFYLPIRITKN